MTQRRIYQNEFPYFVTFRIIESIPLFENVVYAELLSHIIFKSAEIKNHTIISYQIMPDHVHLLVVNDYRAHPSVGARPNDNMMRRTTDRTLESMRSGGSDHERTLSRVRDDNNKEYTISDLIQSIKGYFSRNLHQGNIWQKRFYTRIVNTDKYFETIIYYIKNNPIKAKLSGKYHRIPYQYFNWKIINNFLI